MKNVDLLKDNGVNIDGSLETLRTMETYDMILKIFVKTLAENKEKLTSYKENKDMQNYSILVHAIKSESKSLGFDHLSELALNHELESKANNMSFVLDNFDELLKEIERVSAVSNEYLGM